MISATTTAITEQVKWECATGVWTICVITSAASFCRENTLNCLRSIPSDPSQGNTRLNYISSYEYTFLCSR